MYTIPIRTGTQVIGLWIQENHHKVGLNSAVPRHMQGTKHNRLVCEPPNRCQRSSCASMRIKRLHGSAPPSHELNRSRLPTGHRLAETLPSTDGSRQGALTRGSSVAPSIVARHLIDCHAIRARSPKRHCSASATCQAGDIVHLHHGAIGRNMMPCSRGSGFGSSLPVDSTQTRPNVHPGGFLMEPNPSEAHRG